MFWWILSYVVLSYVVIIPLARKVIRDDAQDGRVLADEMYCATFLILVAPLSILFCLLCGALYLVLRLFSYVWFKAGMLLLNVEKDKVVYHRNSYEWW